MSARTDEGEDWWSDSVDPDPRIDGKPGPPDDWPHRSWFDRKEIDWYWDGRPDPCPVRPIGFVGGVYIFISAEGEIRKFTSAHLHASGGLTDLFGGALWWPLKHFRKINAQGELSGPLQREGCAAALV